MFMKWQNQCIIHNKTRLHNKMLYVRQIYDIKDTYILEKLSTLIEKKNPILYSYMFKKIWYFKHC